MKRLFAAVAASVVSACAIAQAALWRSDVPRHQFFRIPAIIAYGDNIVAFSDNRSGVTDATVWGDVGSVGNISIEARYSTDRGRTWTEPRTVVTGFGTGSFDQSHGDAAVVRDRLSGRMLMMCASGTTGYGRSNATPADDYATALRVGRYYSMDGGHTWNGRDVTADIYSIFNAPADGTPPAGVVRLFFASGRICQSRTIKRGAYYRIYSALTTNCGALVVYSDDFGATWHALGGAAARPAPKGDESKVEELPDGSVLLSCRMMGGRYFNVFRYADGADGGTWGEPVASTSVDDGTAAIENATNGDVLIVPATGADGRKAFVALQSVPRGNNGEHPTNRERRSHVSIYWKAFAGAAQMTAPSNWVGGWQRMEVTSGYSAYSTMNLCGDGSIAFIYEDNSVHFRLGSQFTEVYDIMFRNLTLDEITGGAYAYAVPKCCGR